MFGYKTRIKNNIILHHKSHLMSQISQTIYQTLFFILLCDLLYSHLFLILCAENIYLGIYLPFSQCISPLEIVKTGNIRNRSMTLNINPINLY